MKARKKGQPLPPTGFKARNHRSHISGTARFFGVNASHKQDLLRQQAKRLMRKLNRASSGDANG